VGVVVHAFAEVLPGGGVAVTFGAEEFGDLALLVEAGVGLAVLELSGVLLLHFLLLHLGDLLIAQVVVFQHEGGECVVASAAGGLAHLCFLADQQIVEELYDSI
jgi:hypothetical protein